MIKSRLNPRNGPASHQLQVDTFWRLSKIANGEAGLHLPEAKSAMLKTRIWPRLRALKLDDFSSYAELIESNGGRAERREFIAALTTNISYFFRERGHFEHLKQSVVPTLRNQAAQRSPIRIWSAGCAHGQEPISAAISLLEAGLEPNKHDIKILATDINPHVIAYCRTGRYAGNMLRGIDPVQRSKYFFDAGGSFELCPTIRNMITYKELNLLDPWPMNGKFNVIFYRNVLIHLSVDHQNALWKRFRAIMKSDATLYLGHSERVDADYSQMFKTVAATTYTAGQTVESWKRASERVGYGT